MGNLLQAIYTATHNSIADVASFYRSKNKINAVGDALEYFIKDIFANTLTETDEKTFSYFGNANNPPDLMLINGGDAIEVKKIESENGQIALNSSYPSAKLFADSPMITSTCRNCENWYERDLIYTIGSIKNNKLSLLWFVYGDCYAASREVYERIRTTIADGVISIPGVDFSKTKELGRANKVDPLGITHLRIRGMWTIEHPNKAYRYLDIDYQANKTLRLFALIREAKYYSFPSEDIARLESSVNSNLSIRNVQLKLPDNPVKQVSAKLISYQI
ncbi:NgoPII family restriction endonuclease [Chroogloeocystis siderophila]|uniref:Restriction endonuclease n=1 Tax=Chroogloeocystis siderophila 5.2 s.c.1 TaxID=247279 RepID=A0A1U7HL74_9CHRO|nr:NgoPII family restriction endonuclease [Chroogloeocystis siderophila]OKH24319.1 restriction endonuclease [Chroogloeocystis siderophila 5.2 s.c.1]